MMSISLILKTKRKAANEYGNRFLEQCCETEQTRSQSDFQQKDCLVDAVLDTSPNIAHCSMVYIVNKTYFNFRN